MQDSPKFTVSRTRGVIGSSKGLTVSAGGAAVVVAATVDVVGGKVPEQNLLLLTFA